MISNHLISFLYNRQAHYAMDNRMYTDINRCDSNSEESIDANDMTMFSNLFHPVPDHLLPHHDPNHIVNNDISLHRNHTDRGVQYDRISNHVRPMRHTYSVPPEYNAHLLTHDNTYLSMQRDEYQFDIGNESIQSNNQLMQSIVASPIVRPQDSRRVHRRHRFNVDDAIAIPSAVAVQPNLRNPMQQPNVQHPNSYVQQGQSESMINHGRLERKTSTTSVTSVVSNRAKSSTLLPSDNDMIQLPDDFQPGPQDVVCGRGKFTSEYEGNKVFRDIIEASVQEYATAESKLDKSLIVSAIIRKYEALNPNGAFVRYTKGSWYRIGESMTREKCGHCLRDCLYAQYKSSSKAKAKRRRQEKIRQDSVTSLAASSFNSDENP